METTEAVQALSSLAHETRLGLYRMLVQAGGNGLSVGRINQVLQVPAATLSFHLKELARAGLIARQQQGRFIYYRADYVAMNLLLAYLTENCCQGDVCLPGLHCKTGELS